MEEELNEHELEERLYAMLHHVDETQNNLIDSQQNKDAIQLIENGPRSTMRRYWRAEHNMYPNPYHKVNSAKDHHSAPSPDKPTSTPFKPAPTPARAPVTLATTAKITSASNEAAPKEEKSPPKPPSPVDLTLFQLPVPQNVNKVIEFLDHEEDKAVVLESSDDDEVVEVALPPKPTITIESSDEDELSEVKADEDHKSPEKLDPKLNSDDRAVSASPVPSVVSSVSDDFIRGDCIALNISSRHPDKHSFDFSLHGSDLLGNTSTSKKKKRKKNKEAATSTPLAVTPTTVKPTNATDTCFATPKSKAKNKKQKTKLFTEKSAPNPEVDDSESNLFAANKSKSPYTVTEKSLPNPDVYESDSNQSEIIKVNTDLTKDKDVIEAYSSDSSDNALIEINCKKPTPVVDTSADTVDLTGNDSSYITIDETIMEDNIVMGNVSGLPKTVDYREKDNSSFRGDISKYVSSKIPSILNEDLDFDNLKGNEKVCKKRRYSLTTLRAEMEKFYNESWGGEDFNHKEILKNMSRDKSLWAIDPKDRMQSMVQRKTKCNYCNRVGHRADTCRQRPPVCYMCGNPGHFEPRCPAKICVNCGSPNGMYTSMCGACSGWGRVQCAECGLLGHPASHCPDRWRRYHNTTSVEEDLEMCSQPKKPYQLYCSGCARRGHLVHACRSTIPFSGLPIYPPYVQSYRPLYRPAHGGARGRERSKSFSDVHPKNNKRLSKSPTVHETHVNKKPHLTEDATKTPVQQKSNNVDNNKNKRKSLDSIAPVSTMEKAADFIPIGNASNSSNHDNKGRVLQDNEVSDTSDAIFCSRIFVTDDVIGKLRTKEGEEWLSATSGAHGVTIGAADTNSFLSIRGRLADQEAFQGALREWVRADTNTPTAPDDTPAQQEKEDSTGAENIPKNRNNLLRQINNALDSLKHDHGDPRALYKELVYSQSQHDKMLKQKEISYKQLSNCRTHIKDVLKKLNIVLLGQAGLADGSDHLHELISIQKKLMRSQNKTISIALRKEIGQHYHSIFSATARSDYAALMKLYYVGNSRRVNVAKKRKQRPAQAHAPDCRPGAASQGNAGVVCELPTTVAAETPSRPVPVKENDEKLRPNYLPKLMFYRKRLNDIKGASRTTKADILKLQRRVQTFISMLYQSTKINAKKVKKVRKLNSEVENFLANTENGVL